MCLLHFLNFLLCHVLESSVIPVARVINNSTANNVYEWGLFGLNLKKKSNWGSIQYNSILLLLKNWKRKTSCNLVYKISDYGMKRLCYTPVRRWLFVVVVLSTQTSYQLPTTNKLQAVLSKESFCAKYLATSTLCWIWDKLFSANRLRSDLWWGSLLRINYTIRMIPPYRYWLHLIGQSWWRRSELS